MSPLLFGDLAARVREACAEVTSETSENGQPFLRVPAAMLPTVAALLRRDRALQFDALMDLTAYDRLKFPAAVPSDAIAVVYLLFSYTYRHRLMLEVLAPRAACRVPSVSTVWPAALYFEREVYDLYGVDFAGHPSLQRILCPDDWVGHALRKDYVYPAEYHGVAHLRDGQHFEQAPPRVGDAEPAPTPAVASAAAPAVAKAAPAKGGHS